MSIYHDLRAVAYLQKVFGGRKVFPNPIGHEPGFYHFVESRFGNYYSKIAYLSDPRYTNGVPAIVDVTGDSDRIMIHLD
jgi:hypothetical protein